VRNKVLKTLLNVMYYSGLQRLFSSWTKGAGSILMLHHVRDDAVSQFAPNQHLQITPEFLDQVLTTLKERGYEFVSLDQIHARLGEKNIHRYRKMIAVTLDDGYRDNLENAVPLFRKHNVPFTIFIAPGLIDGRAQLWWEDLSAIIAARDHIVLALPKGRLEFDVSDLDKKHHVFNEILQWLTTEVEEEEQRKIVHELAWMYKIDTKAHCKSQLMNWQEINQLASDPLCTIGAHTIHHYAVARLDEKSAKWEMHESAKILQGELGRMPEHFAYPYGYPAAAGYRDFEIARKLGFKTAVTTRHGVVHKKYAGYLHALPRISLNGNFQSWHYVETLLSGLPALLQNRGRWINIR